MDTIQPQTIIIRSVATKTPTTITVSTPLENAMLDDLYGDSDGGPRKRRRLTHLSPDEKMLRRKLKNRVAAQTARDRKKNQMSDLEIKIAALESENQKLAAENSTLKVESGTLLQENEVLKERLSSIGCSSVKTEMGTGSAVSTDLLQKGQSPPVSCSRKTYAASMLTFSLTLLLASSNKARSKPILLRTPPQYSSIPCLATLSQSPQTTQEPQWWGPQQQSWNPSKN